MYGATTVFNRRLFWEDLRLQFEAGQGPWYIIGDFNACLSAHEKTGRPSSDIFCREFITAIDDYDLVSGDCLNIWASISCISLPRYSSDHNPLLLTYQDWVEPSLFRFRSM